MIVVLGNAGGAHDYHDAGPAIADASGLSVVMLDYRGFGMSDGHASLAALIRAIVMPSRRRRSLPAHSRSQSLLRGRGGSA